MTTDFVSSSYPFFLFPSDVGMRCVQMTDDPHMGFKIIADDGRKVFGGSPKSWPDTGIWAYFLNACLQGAPPEALEINDVIDRLEDADAGEEELEEGEMVVEEEEVEVVEEEVAVAEEEEEEMEEEEEEEEDDQFEEQEHTTPGLFNALRRSSFSALSPATAATPPRSSRAKRRHKRESSFDTPLVSPEFLSK